MRKRIEFANSKSFEVLEFTCENCNQYRAGISADSSAGEYSARHLCFECIRNGEMCWNGELARSDDTNQEPPK